MAVTRLSNSGIKTGVLKYDSSLAGYPGVMPAPTAADGGTGSSATVSFSAISGATNYRAISTPGGFTGTGTSSPVTVSGLTAGTAYTFQIQAQNSVGYGAYSAASNSITPVQPGQFDSIATLTANGAVSSVTFSSIPQTYKHLQIRYVMTSRGNNFATQDIFMRINGVSDSSYGRFNLQNATVTFAQVSQSELRIGSSLGAYTSNQSATPAIIDFLDYTNTTKNKSVRYRSGTDDSLNTSRVALGGGMLQSTSAITSITLLANVALPEESTFALYGIKG